MKMNLVSKRGYQQVRWLITEAGKVVNKIVKACENVLFCSTVFTVDATWLGLLVPDLPLPTHLEVRGLIKYFNVHAV